MSFSLLGYGISAIVPRLSPIPGGEREREVEADDRSVVLFDGVNHVGDDLVPVATVSSATRRPASTMAVQMCSDAPVARPDQSIARTCVMRREANPPAASALAAERGQ